MANDYEDEHSGPDPARLSSQQDERHGSAPGPGGQRDGSGREEPRPRGGDGAGKLRGGLWTTLAVVWTICGLVLTAAAGLWLLRQAGFLDGQPGAAPWATSLLNFKEHALWSNLLIFLVAGVAVWFAGTKLSVYADVIAERTGMGRAFVGLLLLALATSLPEVATTATAALPPVEDPGLMISNLLGGVAMQTAILAVMDLVVLRRGALSYFSPKPVLMIQGVMLVALLTTAILGIAVGSPAWLASLGVGPWGGALLLIFLGMLWMTHSETHHPRWRASNPPEEVDGADVTRREQERFEGVSNRRLYLSFAGGSAVILAAGFLITRVADAVAQQTGVGSTMVGVILLAVSTSLPEISTTAKAVRLGAYGMAFGNIFGSNAFCVVLLFLGDALYRKQPILDAAGDSGLFLAGLGILVTCAYLWGLLERKDRTILGMGIDSVIVLVLYVGGIALLYTMNPAGQR